MKTSIKIILIFLSFFSFETKGQFPNQADPLFYLDFSKAEKLMEKQLRAGDSSSLVSYADLLFVKGDYKNALEFYQLAKLGNVSMGAKEKRNHTHAAMMNGLPSPYALSSSYFEVMELAGTDLFSFNNNHQYSDFGPHYWNGLVLFTSSKKNYKNRGKFRYLLNKMPYLDVHVADVSGNIVRSKFLPRNLNTVWHDGPVSLSADTSFLFVTRNYETVGTDQTQRLYIAYYERNNNKWSEAVILPFCSPSYSVQHPYYHNQERALYFASNKPGGLGGFDLYKSLLTEKGWSEPIHLGQDVNSLYDEVFPLFDLAGNLFYSTNHIETMGGLDLVKYVDGKRYLLPEPINTVFDDFGASFIDSTTLIFSTNRLKGGFVDNLYLARLKPVSKGVVEPNSFQLAVFDAESTAPVDTVWIDILDAATGDSVRLIHDPKDGQMNALLLQYPEAVIRLTAPGYDTLSMTAADLKPAEGSDEKKIQIKKKATPLPTSGVHTLYFANAQPTAIPTDKILKAEYPLYYSQYISQKPQYVRHSGNTEEQVDLFFDKVAQGMDGLQQCATQVYSLLQSNAAISISIAAYTSPIGGLGNNKLIAERRALVVKNFLLNWNNGALRSYLQDGKLAVDVSCHPALMASNETKQPYSNTSDAVFGLEASELRKVSLTWQLVK
jgi:outer membrane protein OmpA-like peptidoglycan-associated protein